MSIIVAQILLRLITGHHAGKMPRPRERIFPPHMGLDAPILPLRERHATADESYFERHNSLRALESTAVLATLSRESPPPLLSLHSRATANLFDTFTTSLSGHNTHGTRHDDKNRAHNRRHRIILDIGWRRDRYVFGASAFWRVDGYCIGAS